MRKRSILLLLVCALLLSSAPSGSSALQISDDPGGGFTRVSTTNFPDVPFMAWYEESIAWMQNYRQGIINGIVDSDGVIRFHPDDPVKRGEFLKMSMTAAQSFTADRSRDNIHWAGRYYTIALENDVLLADPSLSSEPMFPCTFEALEQPITRYEMAVIISNACSNMMMEPTVSTSKAVSNIPDYTAISEYTPDAANVSKGQYVTAVEQAYGKGLLTGYTDGSFHGENSLNRCEAAVVIYRMFWDNARQMPDWAVQPAAGTTGSADFRGYKSFALWLQDGHLNGSTPDAEARELLFGSSNKYYFSSAAEAEPFMESVSVPIWAVDKSGNKYETTGYLTVHYLVANEVKLIFQQIFDDPERFPIYGYSVGGARFTDTMRHSWGCAIDINPLQNCECNFRSGFRATCGYGWWPVNGLPGDGTWVGRSLSQYHGSLSAPTAYSISPYGSVVRAFADYGWGWGGSGTNIVGSAKGWSSGNSFDFMHFSVLPSGG